MVGSGRNGDESSIILAARHAGAPAWFGRSDDDERIARIFVMMKGKPGVVFKEGYGWVLEGETILESIGKLYDPKIKKVVEGGKEETFLFATCQCWRSDCAMVCDYTARVTRNKKGGLDFEGGPLKQHILRAHKGVLFLGVVIAGGASLLEKKTVQERSGSTQHLRGAGEGRNCAGAKSNRPSSPTLTLIRCSSLHSFLRSTFAQSRRSLQLRLCRR